MTYDVHIHGTDIHFPCRPGQTLLDGALQAGIELPYSCRKGVCGQCAGTIKTGEVQCSPSDAAGTGQYLYCQCVPRSDVEIVPAAWHRTDPSARKQFVAKLYRNIRVADDVSVLQLRLPAGQRAKFRAGQYLQVLLPDGSRRSYSMANPPHESEMLQLHIRHVPGGRFTQVVPGLVPGDLLTVELPFGTFELREASTAPMWCVVGGTGFSPVRSLLDDMVKRGIRRAVTLVWGGRRADGLYQMSAVERWRRLWPDFRFIAALEDARHAQDIGGFHGRVDEAVRRHAGTLVGHEVYCCGSPPMVAAVKKACVEGCGLDPHDFLSDAFVPGPAVPPP